jgi:hypothetical protein
LRSTDSMFGDSGLNSTVRIPSSSPIVPISLVNSVRRSVTS